MHKNVLHFGFLSINSNYTVIEIRLHFLESFVNMVLVVLTDTVNLDANSETFYASGFKQNES